MVPAFRINSIWGAILSLCIIIFLIEFYSFEGNKFQNSTLPPHILYMYSYREVWTEGRELDLKLSEYYGKILNNTNPVFYNILHGWNLLLLCYWNRRLWIHDACLIIHKSMIWLLINYFYFNSVVLFLICCTRMHLKFTEDQAAVSHSLE